MTLEQLETLLKALSAHGLSLPQLRTLLSLREEKMTMSKMAKEIGHSTAAATGSIDIMERKGLVVRSHDLGDRRCIHVSLTDKGESILKAIYSSIVHLKSI